MSAGIVYIATGDEFIREAVFSAESVRDKMGDIPITIYTDQDVSGPFDTVVEMSNTLSDFGDSLIKTDMFPYEKNLFLDTDTYLCEDVSEIFELLDDFDIAASHSPGRGAVKDVPRCVREYNTGVVGYVRSESVENVFNHWNTLYEKQRSTSGKTRNQETFTRSIYESDVDFFCLPPEYNARVPRRGYVNGSVKLVHGRHPAGLDQVATNLNESNEARVYYMTSSTFGEPITVIDEAPNAFKLERTILRFKKSLRNDGLYNTIKKGFREFVAKLR